MKKELYEAIELDVIYLKSMDAIAASQDTELEEDELPGFGIQGI